MDEQRKYAILFAATILASETQRDRKQAMPARGLSQLRFFAGQPVFLVFFGVFFVAVGSSLSGVWFFVICPPRTSPAVDLASLRVQVLRMNGGTRVPKARRYSRPS